MASREARQQAIKDAARIVRSGNQWTRRATMPTETKVPTVADALVNHINDVATTAGMLDSIAAGIPKAAYDVEGMTAGFDLSSIVEGGVPDVVHGLEDQLEALGASRDCHEYWRCYCRGYQNMNLLRERAPAGDPRWKQDPVEWMDARMEAARGA